MEIDLGFSKKTRSELFRGQNFFSDRFSPKYLFFFIFSRPGFLPKSHFFFFFTVCVINSKYMNVFFFFFFFWPGLATGSIDAPPTLNFLIHPIMVLSSVSKLCFAVHETSSQRVSTFFRCDSSISLFLFFSPFFSGSSRFELVLCCIPEERTLHLGMLNSHNDVSLSSEYLFLEKLNTCTLSSVCCLANGIYHPCIFWVYFFSVHGITFSNFPFCVPRDQ